MAEPAMFLNLWIILTLCEGVRMCVCCVTTFNISGRDGVTDVTDMIGFSSGCCSFVCHFK